ncbi:unnamed protein product [Acanthoscelides obtectus]|nr:unnamed protein product [Acanthoscelides obtectus]CAK1626333.1 Coiled-coil domain-containing protein 93 [Acanthoscelides obtectus]
MTSVNPDILKKFKNATKLPARQEADGHEIPVEVREDEEQSVKAQEIIDILVAAGYFRAKIKGLSPFDKVVGGMTWCIELCNVDVDVDLLFQENSTIGQKIALTEKIVAVLPKLKCPHRIEPHQIQGLDFIHIFPVVQWLVKRSNEYRIEMAGRVRQYAISQFNKSFAPEQKDVDTKNNMLESMKIVSEVYRPHRYSKRKTAPPADIESRVQLTLLEYGHRGGLRLIAPTSDEIDPEVVMEQEKNYQKKLQQLTNSLVDLKEDASSSYDLSEEDRKKISKHYTSLQLELKDGGALSKEMYRLKTLNDQKQLLTEMTGKLKTMKTAVQGDIEETSTMLESIRLKKQEADKKLKELEEFELNDPEGVKEIEELVALSESLKLQESQFKEQCKKELVQLQNQIEETRKAKAKTPTELNSEIIKEYEDETEKIKVARLQLAKKNRHVAALQRQLDNVPNRAELAQYQKRFLELYNQVAAKHKETKQYYTLYNTLEDTRQYMQRELSLLNSISDSYPEAMSSSSGKEEFLLQFQNIVDSVRQSKMKVEHRLNEEKKKRDELSSTLQGKMFQRKVVFVGPLSIGHCLMYVSRIYPSWFLKNQTMSREKRKGKRRERRKEKQVYEETLGTRINFEV